MRRIARRIWPLLLTVAMLTTACGLGADDTENVDAAAGDPADNDDEAADEGSDEPDTPGTDDAEFVWSWDHGLPLPGTAYDDLFLETLPEMINEGTDGRVAIEVVYGQTDPTETIESLQAGRFDGGSVVLTNYAGNYPLWTLSEVGFVLDSFDEYAQMMRGQPGEYISEDFEEETGLNHLGGTVAWTTNAVFTNDPLETLEDWDGLRIRSASLESEHTIGALGASSVTMPFGDVYTALERGTIDGFQTAMNAALSINPWEVTEYLNAWPVAEGGVFPAVTQEALDELPDDVRKQVEDVFSEFEEVAWEATRADDEDIEQRLVDEGMTLIEPSDEVLQEAQEAAGDELLEGWLDRTGEQGQELLSLLEETL